MHVWSNNHVCGFHIFMMYTFYFSFFHYGVLNFTGLSTVYIFIWVKLNYLLSRSKIGEHLVYLLKRNSQVGRCRNQHSLALSRPISVLKWEESQVCQPNCGSRAGGCLQICEVQKQEDWHEHSNCLAGLSTIPEPQVPSSVKRGVIFRLHTR